MAEGEWEDWDPSEPGVQSSECQRCGQRRLTKPVVDPFVEEGINEGPREPQRWCRPCWGERKDDI